MKNTGIDMLNGPLFGKIVKFAIPILITTIVQQLFTSADTAIIGRFGESGALAAVGTNSEIVAMLVSLSAGLSIGSNVLVSRYIGMGRNDKLEAAVSTSMLSSLILGIVLSSAGFFAAAPLLKLINTPQNIIYNAVKYLRVYCLSIPFLLVYDFASAVEMMIGICLVRIVWVFTVFKSINTLKILYRVFPITWVITSVVVGVSFCIIWKKAKKTVAN